MTYDVIHLIENAALIDDLEYSRLIDQCEQIYRYCADRILCGTQEILTFSDRVTCISTGKASWPGEEAFIRKGSDSESASKRVYFRRALDEIARRQEQRSADWMILIIYTGGCVKRSKRKVFNNWLWEIDTPVLEFAVATEHADEMFLDSFSDPVLVCETLPKSPMIEKLEQIDDMFLFLTEYYAEQAEYAGLYCMQ